MPSGSKNSKALAKSLRQQEWYLHFLEQLKAIAVESVTTSRLALVEGKWLFGQRIYQENDNFKRVKIYGQKIIKTIARDLSRSERDIEYCIQFYKKYPVKDFARACGMLPEGKNITWNKIRTKYLPAPKDEKGRESPEWLRCFDVWNFAGIDLGFGIKDYPGRIPGQIVLNTLYYFTDEGDLVVDPMAGGGTVVDACKHMRRKCLAYDIKPARPEIKLHDVASGFPKEAKGCDLIFLDPPYWKKKKEEYGKDSISSLSRSQYLTFFDKLAKSCYVVLKRGGILAFLMSNYIGYDDPSQSILTADYYQKFKKAGFLPVYEVQCPLLTQQYAGYDVARAKKQKKLLIISRSLYIWQKPERLK